MKKILTLLLILLLLNVLVVYAQDIDMGSEVIDRPSSDNGYTNIVMENPANASGTITSIEIWLNGNASSGDTIVATFENVGGTNFTARDSVTLGAITGGAKRTITTDENSDSIALSVETGDYIGVYITGDASLEYTYNDGGSGIWYLSGNETGCTDTTFSTDSNSDDELSLYATGVDVSITWNGTEISKWNGSEISKWNEVE